MTPNLIELLFIVVLWLELRSLVKKVIAKLDRIEKATGVTKEPTPY